MYACKQCGTGNPLDSSFCKKCGGALPENELVEAKLKLNEMLEEGNNLFTDGRTDEAMLIAEAAVTANPSSHLAFSLKGLCHERVGEIAEALECYEVAVGLNPDSSLDKVKVAALRNRLAQRVSDMPTPNRRSAAIMAGASMVVVLVFGCLVAIGMSSRHEPPKVAANTTPQTQPLAQEFSTAQEAPSPGTTTTPVPPATTTAVTPPSITPYAYGDGRIPGLPYANLNGTLPPANPGVVTEPDRPINPPGPTPGPVDKPKLTDASGPAPEPLGKGPEPAAAPTEDQGSMTISISGRKKSTLGGSEDAKDGHEAATVLQAAQELYQLGRYDQAASKYGKVAGMGGNTPRLQQRLGDCYRNLGKNDASRSAYNRAITMYQTQIKQGRDVAGNQRGLDTCESALKVLGG